MIGDRNYKVTHPTTRDVDLKDNQGRLLIKGTHKDVKVEYDDDNMRKYVPMTNF